MKQFNPNKDYNQFTLAPVWKSYGKARIKCISEVFFPDYGWRKMESFWNPYKDLFCFALMGATHIQFKIVDEFDVERYPDFSINELVKDDK